MYHIIRFIELNINDSNEINYHNIRQYSLDNEEPVIIAYMSGDLAVLEIDLYFKLLEQFSQLKAYYHLKHPDMIKEFVAVSEFFTP